MKKQTLVTIIGLLLVVTMVHVLSRVNVANLRKPVGLTFKPPQVLISKDLIQIAAGEFNGLLADYILLEVGSFMGSDTKATKGDYQSIYHAIKLALALDPYFQQTYLLVQGLLPWRGRMIDEALELLNISRKHRLWDWRPGYYMGFDYYYFKNDYAKASEIFLETAKIENAPLILTVLGARLAVKGQRTEAAIGMLKLMLKNEDLTDYDRLEIEQRLSALSGILRLEKALEQYKSKAHSYPPDLNTLVSQGIIESIPPNPYEEQYDYDPETGRVFFDQLKIKTYKEN